MAKALGFPERCLGRPAAQCLKNKTHHQLRWRWARSGWISRNLDQVLTPERPRHEVRCGDIPTSMVNLQSGHGYVKSGRLRWNHSQVLKFQPDFAQIRAAVP
jgi:hypothetical protein